jgi:hypothetical protein
MQARNVCWRGSAVRSPLGEQPEAVRQPRRHRFHRERTRARRRKLERQRNAVETPADFGQSRRVLGCHAKRRLRGDRAIDEQLHGRRLCQRADARRFARFGNRQRRQRIFLLARDLQQLAARRQDLHARARLQQILRQLRRASARCSQLSRISSSCRFSTCFISVSATARRPPLDAEHRGHRLRHHPRIRERRELDEPHAIRKVVQHIGPCLQRDPRLPKTADARDRHEPILVEPSLHLGNSLSRPTNDVSCCGKLFGRVSSE